MSKISNVFLMLQYLENGRKYTIKELAEKLEVSERMVRVYKEELEKAGIYIDTIMGPYGGYVLNQSIRIPTRKFSKDDYEFLKDLKVSNDKKERLEIIADKVHGVYFDSKNEKIELSNETRNYYNVLTRAIKEKRKVLINYYSFVHGNQDRVIHPLDMFLYNSGWGCAAFCELKSDLRHFELKRINEIKLLDEKF
ncbi:MAG: WYL domain-containing protein [Bacilli bacterium]|nr:WYL domain-containing protein [Bacilli bacterium]